MKIFAEYNIIYIKLFLSTLFLAGNYIAGKFMLVNFSPVTTAFLRFLAASLFLIIFIIKKYDKLPRINFLQFLLIISLGLTGIVGFSVFFFLGLKYISASRASIIISLNPLLITMLSILILREKFTKYIFTGIILSLVGAIIVISKGNLLEFFNKKLGYGEFILFGCVISWAIFSVLGKIAMKKIKPMIAITYACLVGTFILFIPTYLEGGLNRFLQYNLSEWLSIVFMGFFGTALAFTWFYEGIDKIGPSRAGIFINSMPVLTTLLAILILHEKLYFSLVIGAAFVISGVFLTNYQKKSNNIIMEFES